MKKHKLIEILFFALGVTIVSMLFMPRGDVQSLSDDQRYALVDANDQRVLSDLFDDYKNYYGDSIKVLKQKQWFLLNGSNELIPAVAPEPDKERERGYDYDHKTKEGLYHFREKNLLDVYQYGFKNSEGKVVIKAKFDDVEPFHNGLARVEKDGKCGYINRQGAYVHEPIFYSRDCPQKLDGTHPIALAEFVRGPKKRKRYRRGKLAYINERGQLITDFIFESAGEFVDGIAVVSIENESSKESYGIIDQQGNYIMEPQMDYIGAQQEEKLVARKDGQYGYLNKKGQWVIKRQFQKGSDFSEGLAAVKVDNQWGYIDTNGQMIIPPQFDEAEAFVNGKAIVKKGQKGIIDNKGHFIIPPEYKAITPLVNGYFQVADGSYYDQILDSRGQTVLNTGLRNIDIIKRGYGKNSTPQWYIVTTQKGNRGAYDPHWNPILDTVYSRIHFENIYDYFKVEKEGKSLQLDTLGRPLIDAPFEVHKMFVRGSVYLVSKAGEEKRGLWTKDKGLIAPMIYDDIDTFRDKFKVKVNDRYGLINAEGETILELVYLKIVPTPSGLYLVGLPSTTKTITSEQTSDDSIQIQNHLKLELEEQQLFEADSQYLSLFIRDDTVQFMNKSKLPIAQVHLELEQKASNLSDIIEFTFSRDFYYEYQAPGQLPSNGIQAVALSAFVHSNNQQLFQGTRSDVYSIKASFHVLYQGEMIAYEYEHVLPF